MKPGKQTSEEKVSLNETSKSPLVLDSLKAKPYNLSNYLIQNSYIDAIDANGSWRIARILKKTGDVIKLTFEGWSHRWDEDYKIHSNKIAPFKKNTPPFTGPTKPSLKKLNDIEEIFSSNWQKHIRFMMDCLNLKYPMNDANYYNQIMRGEIYFLIDNLMVYPKGFDDDLVKNIIEFFDLFISFTVKFLEAIPLFLKDYNEAKLTYLTNKNVAIVSSFPEIIDTLNKLFGGEPRCYNFFVVNKSKTNQISLNPVLTKSKEADQVTTQIHINIHTFFKLGGFEKLLNVVKWEKSSNGMESKNKAGDLNETISFRAPLIFVKQVLVIFINLARFLANPFKKEKLFKEFLNALLERINAINEKEMKDLDTNLVFSLLRDIPFLFDESPPKEIFKIIEESEIQFCLKLLKSFYLEKRLKGINELKEFIDRVDPLNDYKYRDTNKKLRYFNKEILLQFIIENQIIEFIMGENFHIEVFKRSLNLMSFLSLSGKLTKEHLTALWNVSEEKHNTNKKEVHQIIIDLSKMFSLDALEFIFQRIITVNPEKYDENMVFFIKEITKNAITFILSETEENQKKIITGKKKYEYFGFKLLWELIQDESKLPNNLLKLCLATLGDLFSNFTRIQKSEKEKYLNECFENFKSGNSVSQSLILSLHVFASMQTNSMYGKGTTLEDLIMKYNKEYSFLDTLISDFDKYLTFVGSIIEKQRVIGKKIENLETYIFVGKNSHFEQIENRLSFIDNINPFLGKKAELNLDHLKRLWVILVKNCISIVEQNLFLDWLNKKKESNDAKKNFLLNDNLMKNFFNLLLNDKIMIDYTSMNLNIYNCLKKMFEAINMKEGNLEYSDSIKVYKYDQLVGFKYLWTILIKCNNEEVLKACKSYLIAIHLQMSNSFNLDQKISIFQKFFVKCVEYLNDSSIPSSNIANIVLLLKNFILNFDGQKYLNGDTPSQTNFTLTVQLRNEEYSKVLSFTLPLNSTFRLLRNKINDEFNLKNQDFDIYISKNTYKMPFEKEEEYQVSIIDNYRDKDYDIFVILNKYSNQLNLMKDKFKTIVANNQKISDILFDKLSEPNDKIVKEVWEVLKLLPINKNVRKRIEKNSFDGTEENLIKLLDCSCYRKFLYCLEIIEEILTNENSPAKENEIWGLEFCKKKGFNHLFKIFTSLNLDEVKSPFNLKCFALLSKLISFFIKKYYEVLSIENKNLSELLFKCLQLLKETFVHSFDLENQIPEEFLDNNFELLLSCLYYNPSLIKILYNYSDLFIILNFSLLECEISNMRKKMKNNFINLVEFYSKTSSKSKDDLPPHLFFITFLLKSILYKTNFDKYRDKCDQFFSFLCKMLSLLSIDDLVIVKSNQSNIFSIQELFQFTMSEFMSVSIFEKNQEEKDYLLQGYLQLFESLIELEPNFKEQLENNSKFLNYLFYSGLFEMPTGLESPGKILPPKCKNPETREKAFNLLSSILIYHMNPGSAAIDTINQLKTLLSNAYWRTNSVLDWSISPFNMEKSLTGYVGLKNLGCTCYMNSLIQQLFMIGNFREGILNLDDISLFKNDFNDNLLYQFQLILAGLKFSHKQYIDPRRLCISFKGPDGNPINVLEQMDADEFFNEFFDRLETILKGNPADAKIKRIFCGVLSNELICKGCPHYSEREEVFHTLGLQVKNKRNIQESLQSFIQGEMLEGPNAYFCETCNKKIPTLKRVCVKRLPNILILVLKRFEFDYDTMTKIKVNDFCEFPSKFSLEQYTQGYLKKKEKEKYFAENETETPTDDGEEIKYPPEYFEYKLRGVVIHMGTADSGHYYSLINASENESNDKWIEFNDTIVRPFDLKNLPNEAYGGEERGSSINIAGLSRTALEKSRNAYLIFYERVKFYEEKDGVIGENNNIFESSMKFGENLHQPHFSKIYGEIKDDNVKYYFHKNLFDQKFMSFMEIILVKLNEENKISLKNYQDLIKMSFLYFFTILIRAKDKDNIPIYLKNLKSVLNVDLEIANWFLLNVSNENILKENLIDCPWKEMKCIFLDLAKSALRTVDNNEKNLEFVQFKSGNLAKFISSCIYILHEYKNKKKLMDLFYKLFNYFSHFSRNCKQMLIKAKVIGRICYHLNDTMPPTNSYLDFKEFHILNNSKDLGVASNESEMSLIKSYEELAEKRKEKTYLETLSTNYSNLIICLCNLVKCSKLYQSTKEDSLQIKFKLENDELNFIKSVGLWKKIMLEAKSNFSSKYVTEFFCYICLKNENISIELLNVLFEEMNEYDDNEIKIYLKIAEEVLAINDEFQSKRINIFLERFFSFFNKNYKFYRCIDISLDYLFNISIKNNNVLIELSNYLKSQENLYQIMEEWIKNSENINQNLQNQKVKLHKKKNYSNNYQISYSNQNKIYKKSQRRLDYLKNLLKQEPESMTPDYESDIEIEECKLELNEKYDVIVDNNYNNISSYVLVDLLDELICMKELNSNILKWFILDQIRIGPYKKMEEYYDQLLDVFK